jgi:hypothetical protein
MDFFFIDLLDFKDNFLFIYCIYEFYLDFNDYFFNKFNYTFFSRSLIYNKSNSKIIEKDLKPFNFLTSTYFSFCTELLELGDKKKIFNKTLYKYFKI